VFVRIRANPEEDDGQMMRAASGLEKDIIMLVLAIGTFTDPSKIGPYAEAETATIHAHKAAGVVAQAYQRVDGKGVALVWRVESLAEARERIGQLPFSKHGLMTVELTEIVGF
jgi:hypothetical protein